MMRTKALALCFLGITMAPVVARASSVDEGAAMSVVPFKLEMSAGSLRPMVEASINGHAFPMMVHSNASSYVQLRHAQATSFGVRDLRAKSKGFGIVSPGKVSHLGRDVGHVDRLQVGDSIDRDAKVDVFEIVQDDRGMLGIDWIRDNRVILDYASDKAAVDPTPAYIGAMRARLLASGYTAVSMTYDPSLRRFTIPTTIGSATRSMTVASATSTALDKAMAEAAGVQKGRGAGQANGPTGTSIPIFHTAKPVTFGLAGWTSAPVSDATIEDTYGYIDQARPTDPARLNGGTLGSDFLAASHAVVDFGNGVLYVK